MNLQHQLDNTDGANGSARKMKQVSPHDKPPPTNVGRLIQPNNLKIDELIALIQVENFDVIALNETFIDTQNKHLFAKVTIYGYQGFHVGKINCHITGGGSSRNWWINHLCQKYLEPLKESQGIETFVNTLKESQDPVKFPSIPKMQYCTPETCTDT